MPGKSATTTAVATRLENDLVVRLDTLAQERSISRGEALKTAVIAGFDALAGDGVTPSRRPLPHRMSIRELGTEVGRLTLEAKRLDVAWDRARESNARGAQARAELLGARVDYLKACADALRGEIQERTDRAVVRAGELREREEERLERERKREEAKQEKEARAVRRRAKKLSPEEPTPDATEDRPVG